MEQLLLHHVRRKVLKVRTLYQTLIQHHSFTRKTLHGRRHQIFPMKIWAQNFKYRPSL